MKLAKSIWLPLVILCVLCMLDLFFSRSAAGLEINSTNNWFWEFRMPRVLAAMGAGISLAISGLILQTLFRNPLAGPFLTGITPGASLGIGILLMAFPAGMHMGWAHHLGITGVGFLGGILVLLIQLYISRKQTGVFTLLLSGVMLGYMAGAATEILQTIADAQQLRSFVMWGLGNFDRVQLQELYYFLPISIIGMFVVFALRHKLDAWLPGELYAQNAGINTKKLRLQIILITGLLAGVTTAICGPIGFVGLAAPHLSRILLQTGTHSKLWLHTAVWGAIFCVFADFVAHNLLYQLTLNVNAICAVFGAPIVLYVMLKRKTGT
ncbi:MAG: iron ABC transporter permease [Bacteroidia bacterium]|nr:iron ABC transporter permease [Bacteroidia bacterium]